MRVLAAGFVLLAAALAVATCAPAVRQEQEQEVEVKESAYEKLESFGFPAGLLPHRVVGYTVDSGGKFWLALESACSAMLQETYMVTYAGQISGTLSYGSIKHLKGVSVRAFLVDWSIGGIHIHGSDLVFEVGIASAKFPVANFDDSPQCSDERALLSTS